MDILNNEILTLTSATYDDISYYWHLTHLAYIFIEYDYTQYAEKVWKQVLDMYQSSYEEIVVQPKETRSSFSQRVLSIVTNTKNEMSVMYYNQGKLGLFKEIQDELTKNSYQLYTTSKYFDSTNVNFILTKDDSDMVACK